MRQALAVLAVIALIVVGAWAYLRSPAPVASPAPSPTAVASVSPSAIASASPAATATATADPTPTGTPVPFGRPVSAGEVTVRAASASAGPDFRYIAVGDPSGGPSWVVLLDLGARTTRAVAQIEIKIPPGAQAGPSVEVTGTTDGRRALIAITEVIGRTHLFLLDARAGSARLLTTLSASATAVISPDGARFAFNDRSSDPSRNGVWVGTTSDGATRRVIVDDPQRAAAPPRPLAFSTDGSRLAVAVDHGPGNSDIAIVRITADARVTAGSVEGATVLERGTAFTWLGAPADAWSWDSVGPFGGENAVYTYNVDSGAGTEVYRPPTGMVLRDMQRSPRLDRFMTEEGPGVIDQGRGAFWVRTRAGGATKVADVGMTGPFRPWWSPDGSKLYALGGGDDSVGSVVELLTGRGVLSFCRRSPAPPCV